MNFNLYIIKITIDCLLCLCDRWCRFDGCTEYDRTSITHSSKNSARMIRFFHCFAIHTDKIIIIL